MSSTITPHSGSWSLIKLQRGTGHKLTVHAAEGDKTWESGRIISVKIRGDVVHVLTFEGRDMHHWSLLSPKGKKTDLTVLGLYQEQ